MSPSRPLLAVLLSLGCALAGPASGAEAVLTVCPPAPARAGCDFSSLAAAARAARAGAIIVLRAGIYREAAVLRATRLTLRAEPGAHLIGVAAQGKAALVVTGDDIVIEGLECSGIQVPHGNGACIRAEGLNLTLRRVHFHDSQQGFLGGRGRIVIEDSRFERLGGDRATRIGSAHAIYVGQRADEFILRRSLVLASKDEGHEVKSRARRTVIEDSIVASLDGVDSRQIDVPNGGDVVIRANVLQKGPNSSNPDFIGIGLERGRTAAIDHAASRTVIEGNTFIVDRPAGAGAVRVLDVPAPLFAGNTLVGGAPAPGIAERWFPDRAAAGLAPFPDLPDRPLP